MDTEGPQWPWKDKRHRPQARRKRTENHGAGRPEALLRLGADAASGTPDEILLGSEIDERLWPRGRRLERPMPPSVAHGSVRRPSGQGGHRCASANAGQAQGRSAAVRASRATPNLGKLVSAGTKAVAAQPCWTKGGKRRLTIRLTLSSRQSRVYARKAQSGHYTKVPQMAMMSRDAPALQAGSRWFKSSIAHHNIKVRT